ncbi:hypothetical protein D3C84_1287680 [compost metagenome]
MNVDRERNRTNRKFNLDIEVDRSSRLERYVRNRMRRISITSKRPLLAHRACAVEMNECQVREAIFVGF